MLWTWKKDEKTRVYICELHRVRFLKFDQMWDVDLRRERDFWAGSDLLLSFNRSCSIESFKRSVTDNEADHDHPKDEPSPQDDAPKEDCPDLAPYCLSDDSQDGCCLLLNAF